MRLRVLFPAVLPWLLAMPAAGPATAAPQEAEDESVRRVEDPAVPTRAWKFEDRGTDLVVSKVLFERGEFGGRDRIKYQVWIRNMCNDGVPGRIKVAFTSQGHAIWIEGGIGAKQEKASAAYYMDPSGFRCCGSEVVVDPDDAIEETNEDNNACNASFRASAERTLTTCTITGPHCEDRDMPRFERDPKVPVRPR